VRFGFLLFPYSRFGSIEEVADAVVVAEGLGFSSCVMPHHLLPPAWPSAPLAGKVWFDPLVLSAFLAARTSRLVFRTAVMVAPYLQPIPLAKAVVTLDIVSQQRFRLGLGVGWMRAEFRRLGIPFNQRGALTDEYVAVMRELWTADQPAFSGTHVAFDDVSFLPRPASGRIPIDFGGSGPSVFRRIAALGDGWYPLALSPDEVAAGVTEIHALLAGVGRDPTELTVTATVTADLNDPETGSMANHVAQEGGRDDALAEGVPEPRSLSSDECIAHIERFREAGVTDVTLEFSWNTADALVSRLSWFAREVLPAVS
jgi:probable F420-dependent oxidoreductase